ncbi:ATP synthase F0 subunit B [bacterium]|nr:ATP synthase F0 subunit B [bacterium]|tara:strand:+ start:1067 stop:1516 length:450 start_codon:yes stop_codon:yes gene_type:complete
MEQLIQAFGIDLKLIVVQIINFAALVALLSYFLYKPLMKMIEVREEKIAQGIKDAEQAAESLSQAESEKAEILTQAHREADSVSERATQSAKEKAETILSEAEVKAVDAIKNAEIRGEEIKKESKSEAEAEIAKMAVLAAEKVLKEKIS